MTDQPSREGDSERFVIWLCDECGWHILDENSAGEGQPCEAWLIGPDEIEEHGPTRRVELIPASTLQARAEAAEAREDALRGGIEQIAALDADQFPGYANNPVVMARSLLSTQEPTR